jgi:Fur family peroxide stress response transcriptional regulator
MEPSKEEIQLRMDRFETALHTSGIKLTHQRIEIFREVARTGDHPDAKTIFERVKKRMPTISLDTVYRTLIMLIDMGLITTFNSSRGKVRFDANVDLHHHFVCTKCGMVSDFYSEEFNDLEVPRQVSEVGDVATAHVQFRGLCSRCRDREDKQ